MLLIRYFLFISLFFNFLYKSPKDKNIFRPPLKIPVLLSANFGELRIDHFHSGIDIKTEGTTGKEVVSSSDGYIYRISVSPGGFGKALYVRHPSGYSTVYAHLDRFIPEIEEYVKTKQYERESFLVTLFPSAEDFPVKQGQLIAYSGNSGSSGGPHLHFEVRESGNETPVNPLLFNFGISDNIPPVIEKLAIYPLGRNSYINNKNKSVKINVSKEKGRYTLLNEKEILLSGNIGFGLKTFDLLSGSGNRCATYAIEVKIDSQIIFKYSMDGFSFDESRYVNSHIDYETLMRDNMYIERAFVLPNDKLDLYKGTINRGIFRFNDEKIHDIVITARDINGNKSTLSFKVRSQQEKPAEISAPDSRLTIMPFNKTNKFSTEDVMINIPSGALYDTIYFSFRKTEGTPVMLSGLYSIHNLFTPVQKPYTLAIKPTTIPAGKESKMLIVGLFENMSRKPISSTWSDGFLKAEVTSFGDYFIGIDTIAPIISAGSLSQGINLTGRKEIKINITDDFSGIKNYVPVIDGKWALFEYDPKNEVIVYKFDETKITKGSKHHFSLKVSDNLNNVRTYNCDFIW